MKEDKTNEIQNMLDNISVDKMTLMERIVCVMNEIRITKTGKNTFSNYLYFKPEMINQVINPLLLKYKVFPHFTTENETLPIKSIDLNHNDGDCVYNVQTEYTNREVAVLTLVDMLNKEEKIRYVMPIKDIDIKGANKMQNTGGVRTYAKRYLYMEAFNISDDSLDLDSDQMQEKGKKKAVSSETRVNDLIEKIRIKANALKNAGMTDKEIAAAIKEVYTYEGEPSCNYMTCQTVEDANIILQALNKL